MHDPNTQAPRPAWKRLLALAALALLALGGGCDTVKARWTGMHYALAFYPLADASTPAEQRTISIAAPDGKPVRILTAGLLSSRSILAVEPVRDGKAVTTLRLHLEPHANCMWMQMQQTLRGGSFAVVADGSLCIGVFRATPEMFPEECIIDLPGPWDPDIAEALSRYAPTNYTLFHE